MFFSPFNNKKICDISKLQYYILDILKSQTIVCLIGENSNE